MKDKRSNTSLLILYINTSQASSPVNTFSSLAYSTWALLKMEETTTFHGLGHLFITIFLYCFSSFIVAPVITDISMAALCPGKDECSLAIYLSGFQQVVRTIYKLNPLLHYLCFKKQKISDCFFVLCEIQLIFITNRSHVSSLSIF